MFCDLNLLRMERSGACPPLLSSLSVFENLSKSKQRPPEKRTNYFIFDNFHEIRETEPEHAPISILAHSMCEICAAVSNFDTFSVCMDGYFTKYRRTRSMSM